MRILHCSDFHGRRPWYHWLIKESPGFDLVCFSGDLLDLDSSEPLEAQINWILPALREIQAPLAVCSGNHDSEPGGNPRLSHAAWLQELRRPGVWIDGDRFEVGGSQFRSVSWLSPELPAGANETWIVHAPPDQCATAISEARDWGEFGFGEQCRARRGPKLALCGHVHHPINWWARVGRTLSLNPGHAGANDIPTRIEIDLDRGRAILRGSLAGDEIVAL
jgi:predicted phosphodiesterase